MLPEKKKKTKKKKTTQTPINTGLEALLSDKNS